MTKSTIFYNYGLARNVASLAHSMLTYDSADEAHDALLKHCEDRRANPLVPYKKHDWAIVEITRTETFNDDGFFLESIVTAKTVAFIYY